MDEGQIEQAVARIEAALARLEHAAEAPADLLRRHERLKASVAQSLDEIDKLIAGQRA